MDSLKHVEQVTLAAELTTIETPFPTSSKASTALVAEFTQGSLLRHICVMTCTSAIGLISIFAVDFLSLFYISRLNNPELTAAVGYASQLIFAAISINIGLTIGITALVSRAIGAGERAKAQRLAASSLSCILGISALVMVVFWFFRHALLSACLGAQGVVLDHASRYLGIATFSLLPLSLGMAFGGLLRAVGDAKRAMFITLFGAVFTAVCDPLLIFGLHLGLTGAAITAVFEASAMAIVGIHGVVRIHRFLLVPRWVYVWRDAPAMMAVAVPAVLTNLATPFSAFIVTRTLSDFGPDAIVASTVIDRMSPLAFGALFALSGALGPIIGQNYGARKFTRVRETLTLCFVITTLYCLFVWAALALGANSLAILFNTPPKATQFLVFYCHYGVALWLFLGLLFVSNAAFNNLGCAAWSTGFNWGRATVGTVPLATFGASMGGVQGVYFGLMLGCAAFGLAALIVAFWHVRSLAQSGE